MKLLLVDKNQTGIKRHVPTFARAFGVLKEETTKKEQKIEKVEETVKEKRAKFLSTLLKASIDLHENCFKYSRMFTNANYFRPEMERAIESLREIMQYKEYLTGEQVKFIEASIEAGDYQLYLYEHGEDTFSNGQTGWSIFHSLISDLDELLVLLEELLLYTARNTARENGISDTQLRTQITDLLSSKDKPTEGAKVRNFQKRMTESLKIPERMDDSTKRAMEAMHGLAVSLSTGHVSTNIDFTGSPSFNNYIVEANAFTTKKVEELNRAIKRYKGKFDYRTK